jgi:hypothetical protein
MVLFGYGRHTERMRMFEYVEHATMFLRAQQLRERARCSYVNARAQVPTGEHVSFLSFLFPDFPEMSFTSFTFPIFAKPKHVGLHPSIRTHLDIAGRADIVRLLRTG